MTSKNNIRSNNDGNKNNNILAMVIILITINRKANLEINKIVAK